MLLIDRYTKLYGKKVAVDNLSLHIKPGEIYGFIGHNGAGKTTTLKACAGILNFEYGNILIDGISIKEKPMECKKKIAYIPDNPDLYGFLTGAAYLNFIADIYKVPLEIRNKRIEDFADKYGESYREEDREAEGMGCVFCFENDDFEPYVYCVESDEFGLTYHRFTREDYEELSR